MSNKNVVLKAGVTGQLGDGVKTVVNGNILTITLDLTEDFGPSGTGKTNIIASTRGGVQFPGSNGAILSLNLYKRV